MKQKMKNLLKLLKSYVIYDDLTITTIKECIYDLLEYDHLMEIRYSDLYILLNEAIYYDIDDDLKDRTINEIEAIMKRNNISYKYTQPEED